MAQRRMFSKEITSSSNFLMMPQTAQCLYFHLGMNADDDGFVEQFTVMRMTGSNPDDLKVLQLKGFVHVFDDKVLVILDWKENNYLRSDRYKPSKYLEQYKNELAVLSEKDNNLQLGIPTDNHLDNQVRLGKVITINSNQNQKTVDELWTEMIKDYLPKYAPSMIDEFVRHWRAKNYNGKKELWQMKEVFDMGRRLATWKSNEEKWQFQNDSKKTVPQGTIKAEPRQANTNGLEKLSFNI